ncbi:MAG TPA: DUF4402 domain-containing protein [Bacteroidales bacterium]|nr:DUF4402 domain-containing protein [Bacteroidales bacterium]
MKKLFFVTAIMLGFAAGAFAQVSATASAEATIVTPIAITKTVDMNFGNVAVNSTAGTVVLATDGSRTTTGGVTLPVTAGSPAAASFTVTGTAGYTYAITLPGATTIANGVITMGVDTWTSSPDATGTLTGGTETLTVGATLHVGAAQAAGVYSNATACPVTVNYN